MSFADYALTMDLLESELIETLAEENAAASHERVPVGCRYGTPTFLGDACAGHGAPHLRGGPVALLAAARPANAIGRKQPDYALLVQERRPAC